MSSRRTWIEIIYEGQNITEDIAEYVESFEYDDAEDQSDSISLTLRNMDWIWLDEWMPQLGDKINPIIYHINGDGDEDSYDCGEFVVDDISFSGRPTVCVLSAVSSPVDEGFSATQRTKNWQGVTLAQIGTEIAAAAGVSFEMQAPDVSIASKEQSHQTDSAFLKGLCDKYGYTMKVYSNRIIIIDPIQYEEADSVEVFDESAFSKWDYVATIGGTYTGVKLTYTNSKGEVFSAALGDTATRCLELNETCTDNADAENIARGKVNKANESAFLFSATLREAAFISSTSVIEIEDMSSISDRYYVKKVKHTISNGYTVAIEARKIVERIGNSAPAVDVSGYPTLRYSNTDANSGGYVSQMQALLVSKGFPLPIFGVDGKFFSETQAAVKACQTAAGIAVDGICGPNTWTVLLS